MHLYDLFKEFCPSAPNLSIRKPDLRTNNVYTEIYFKTYSLPCFNYYHELFYKNGVKEVPKNIMELLTAQALAYLACDDGNKKGSGFILNTNSFSLKGVQELIKVINKKFDLDCTIQNKKRQNNQIEYLIYIKANSMNNFRALVKQYFHESMLYKLK